MRALLTLLLAVSACAPQTRAPESEPVDAARLYQRQCAVCHGATGAGDGPSAGINRPANLREIAPETSDAELAAVIREGRGLMLPWVTSPTVKSRRSCVMCVASQKSPRLPAANSRRGTCSRTPPAGAMDACSTQKTSSTGWTRSSSARRAIRSTPSSRRSAIQGVPRSARASSATSRSWRRTSSTGRSARWWCSRRRRLTPARSTARFVLHGLGNATPHAPGRVPYAGVSPDRAQGLDRLGALWRAGRMEAGDVLVTSAVAWARRGAPHAALDARSIRIACDDELEVGSLRERLLAGGYAHVGLVEDAGTFSVRGDIVDIFPTDDERPVRIELYGDLVESIRRFDPVTQRNGEAVDALHVFPAREECWTRRRSRARVRASRTSGRCSASRRTKPRPC